MKDFEIGARVVVKALSVMGYDGNRRVIDRSLIVPTDAVITGRAIRYVGRYNKARGGFYGHDIEDYEQASLRVTGSVDLWCVRFGLLNREHLVQDADLEPGSVLPHTTDTYWKFPKRAKRITYIAPPDEPVTVEPSELKRITFREPILLT